MKKNLLTVICIFSATYLYGQKIEVSVLANTGLFRYGGQSAASSSFISQGQNNVGNYTNNPYGNINAVSYGFGFQGQLVAKCGAILGLQATYDVLRSKVNITQVFPYYDILPFINSYYILPPTTGKTFLENEAINLNPYIGYRFGHKKIRVDVMPGIDIGFTLSSYDKGKATTTYNGNDMVYQTDYKRSNLPADIRLRIGLAGYYNKFGINASFAYGKTNYQKDLLGGGVNDVHSRLMRLGVSYRIY